MRREGQSERFNDLYGNISVYLFEVTLVRVFCINIYIDISLHLIIKM